MLPTWMQWVQAVAVLIIALLGSWIAYKQARIAEAKLNFDLYDKRFEVFEGAKALIVKFLQEANLETRDILVFNARVADATFIFGQEVEVYLTELRKKAAALHAKNEQLKAVVDNDKRRNKLVDEIYERPLARFVSRQGSRISVHLSHAPFGSRIHRMAKCQQLMTIARIEPDWLRDDGSEIQTFECEACGGSLTRSIRGRDRGP
jgi:hypothetical protein